jgi:sec-independent protein translocase protein TatC
MRRMGGHAMAVSNATGDDRLAGSPTAAPGPDPDDEDVGGTMTLIEHLEELRKRMLIALAGIAGATIVSFFFWENILQFLVTPLPAISNHLVGYDGHKLVQHDVGEAFVIALKLSLAMGLVIASPLILYQIWAFLSPALTRRERRYALPFTLLGVALFAVGIAVGFVVMRFPLAWLIDFGAKDFVLLPDAGAYFSFVAFFLLAFGIVFELPMMLTFLGMVGLVRSQTLRRKRAYILFGLWLAACFITPGADPYSPVIIGVAFTILFELSIVLLRILKK